MPYRVTRRNLVTALAATLAALLVFAPTLAARQLAVSKGAEAIHQEVTFAASRHRVYVALTDAVQFTAVTALGPMKGAPPAQISRDAGGVFSLFGGHILGRQIELVPDQRLVQAWRTVDWPPGVYSIARFELKGDGAQTTLVFDHTGFPAGETASLAKGWTEHYWEPLKLYLK